MREFTPKGYPNFTQTHGKVQASRTKIRARMEAGFIVSVFSLQAVTPAMESGTNVLNIHR